MVVCIRHIADCRFPCENGCITVFRLGDHFDLRATRTGIIRQHWDYNRRTCILYQSGGGIIHRSDQGANNDQIDPGCDTFTIGIANIVNQKVKARIASTGCRGKGNRTRRCVDRGSTMNRNGINRNAGNIQVEINIDIVASYIDNYRAVFCGNAQIILGYRIIIDGIDCNGHLGGITQAACVAHAVNEVITAMEVYMRIVFEISITQIGERTVRRGSETLKSQGTTTGGRIII